MLKKLLKRDYYFWINIISFTFVTLLFALLLFKNPYSERTLLPNLDPFPDTLHYLVSAKSIIDGQGWYLVREGRQLQTGVPPLYSLVLSPIFLFSDSPVNYYFINLLLSLASFLLIFQIIKKITDNLLIRLITILFFATNYFIYWVPTLAMAENLSLPLFLLGALIILSPTRIRNLFLGGVVAVAIYATKYAHISISICLLISLIFKIIYERPTQHKKTFIKKLGILFTAFLISFTTLVIFETQFKGRSTIDSLLSFLSLLIPIRGEEKVGSSISNSWFALDYLKTNLPLYLSALKGDSIRFLWDYTPMINKLTAISGLIGLILGCFQKGTRLLFIYLAFSLISSILFLSTFYSVDARYIYHAIPILIIGMGFSFEFLSKFFKNYNVLLNAILIIIIASYFVMAFPRLKSQISLNLKYSETPWSYIAAQNLDSFFVPLDDSKIVLISPMPPYYLDFFVHKKIKILPISNEQEFRHSKEIVWGEDNYSDLINLYKTYLDRGYKIFVSDYGLGNEGYLHKAFDSINNNFNLEKVDTNCFNVCNIYKIKSMKTK